MSELRGNRCLVGETGLHIEDLDLNLEPRTVYLKGVGLIRVAKTCDQQNGRVRYLCCSDLSVEDLRETYTQRWKIEVDHRELKQTVNIAGCQARKARSQRNHIFCALFAYCALQFHKMRTGLNAYQVKRTIFDPVIKSYLQNPLVSLEFTS